MELKLNLTGHQMVNTTALKRYGTMPSAEKDFQETPRLLARKALAGNGLESPEKRLAFFASGR
jgi:hypothetical protein